MVQRSEHYHPNRHRKALRSALILFAVGTLIWMAGLVAVFLQTSSGLIASLMVIGVTAILLSPVWYFTYMEKLEPELYQHEK